MRRLPGLRGVLTPGGSKEVAVLRTLFGMLLLLGVGGCAPASRDDGSRKAEAAAADQSGAASNPAEAEASLPPLSEPPASQPEESEPEATAGGDGSEIVLGPLSPAEIQAAKLAGELACSFETAGAVMMTARGNAGSNERAQGIVKVGDYVEPVGAPGGYDAMARGTRFDGKGKTIRIAVSRAAQSGGESPPRFASLTYDRADGAQRTFKGYWVCGP